MRVWSHFIYDGGFWFRLFGRWGLSISDKIKNPPLFSEQHGYRKICRIGKWGIEILVPPTASWDLREADPIEDLYGAMKVLSPTGEAKKYWEQKIVNHKREKVEKNGGSE